MPLFTVDRVVYYVPDIVPGMPLIRYVHWDSPSYSELMKVAKDLANHSEVSVVKVYQGWSRKPTAEYVRDEVSGRVAAITSGEVGKK